MTSLKHLAKFVIFLSNYFFLAGFMKLGLFSNFWEKQKSIIKFLSSCWNRLEISNCKFSFPVQITTLKYIFSKRISDYEILEYLQHDSQKLQKQLYERINLFESKKWKFGWENYRKNRKLSCRNFIEFPNRFFFRFEYFSQNWREFSSRSRRYGIFNFRGHLTFLAWPNF